MMIPTGKAYVFFSILYNRCYCVDEVFDVVKRRFDNSGHWYTVKPHKPGWQCILFADLGYREKSELHHKFDDINHYYKKRVATSNQRGFTPEQLAKIDAMFDNMAVEIPGLMNDEPDGTQFYDYTIESRYGVPVGVDWLPGSCRAIVPYVAPAIAPKPTTPAVICLPAPLVVSLWHESMVA